MFCEDGDRAVGGSEHSPWGPILTRRRPVFLAVPCPLEPSLAEEVRLL